MLLCCGVLCGGCIELLCAVRVSGRRVYDTGFVYIIEGVRACAVDTWSVVTSR